MGGTEESLRAELKALKEELNAAKAEVASLKSRTSVRAPIAQMSSEVVDTNPYSRLMALKRMGIVKNYERIRVN